MQGIKIGGAVIFWGPSEWTVRKDYLRGLRNLGLEKFVPEPRSGPNCLKEALGQIHTSRGHRVESLARVGHFEVIDVEKGEDENQYRRVCKATVNEANQLTLEPYEAQRAVVLIDTFNKQLGLLRGSQVSTSLVNIITSLGGTRLRPNGSVYWLPESQLERWAQIGQVVENSSQGRKSSVYILRHQMDADAVKAIRDAIVQEISQEASKMENEILDPESSLGDRALENRRAEALCLRAKVKQYEELLDLGLTDLRGQLDGLETVIAKAALLASVTVEV